MAPSREDAIETARTPPAGMWATWRALPPARRAGLTRWAGYALVVTALFVQPLAGLLRLAAESEQHSHIPLMPLVVGYLLYTHRRPGADRYEPRGTACPEQDRGKRGVARRPPVGAIALGGIALAALAVAFIWRGSLSDTDHLALTTLAYISLVPAGGFLFLGSQWMAASAFPLAFLLFMVPLPDAATHWLETMLIRGSADVSAMLFNLAGTSYVRDSLVFELRTITLLIAEECSGIRSTWVLFITSLLASHLFLGSPWRRLLLVAVVFPLGIVRNGFRILTIGLLCVHIGPHMIDSVIHNRGGPLFFAVSLVPLFLLVWWLRRHDRRVTLPG